MGRFTDPTLYTEARREERMRLAEKRAEGIALHHFGKKKWDDLTEHEQGIAAYIMSDVISGMNFYKAPGGGLIDFEQMDIERGIFINYND